MIHGTAFATLTLANNFLGLAPGPIVTGWLADRIGLLGALSWLPLASVAAALVFLLARQTSRADPRLRGVRQWLQFMRSRLRLSGVGPGLLASLVIAAAAAFLADNYGGPVMLFALLLGMAMNFLGEVEQCRAGIAFASRTVLRIGVAMLGFRITLWENCGLGWQPVALVIAVVTLTILASIVAGATNGVRARNLAC